ncbi:MAG: HNH endonuclease [Terriglobales bacterium]
MTDRALRFRARRTIRFGWAACHWCGATADLMPHHLDGHEENNTPANLLLVCRSCNVRAGNTLRKAGLGRKTRQYNPFYVITNPAEKGAEGLAEWIEAARVATGQIHPARMPLEQAIRTVQATPPARRTRFAREIWALRRERGTDRNAAIPF